MMDEFVRSLDENPMPTKHQLFCLVLATVIGFAARVLTEKAYLKIWSRKGR